MLWGQHLIKSWSSTQQVIALSSAEAELYAILKGAAQTKGLMSMMSELGYAVQGRVISDASAALGIAHRQGLGKVRHIDVQYLWIQDEIREKRLSLDKVHTNENPADMITKASKAETLHYHYTNLGLRSETSRAKTAPRLQNHEHVEQC